MATYNGEKFIAQQISSILCQLGKRDELIVSDDGSTDATCAIVKSFQDARINLIYSPNPGSPVRNFEHAIRHARGDHIFLADQDDIWEPHKLHVQSGLLDNFDLVVSDCCLIDAEGNPLADSFFMLRGSGPGFWKNIYKNTFLGCCLAFRSTLLKKIVPFPAGIAMHDIWIGLIAELYGTTYFCSDKLVRYRRHDNTLTQTGSKSALSVWRQIGYRVQLMSAVLCRKVQ
jgi:glycosyltransferase involved in cell wall biosynthesis